MVKTSNLMMLKILLVTNLPSVELKVPKLRLQTEIGISRKIKKKFLDFTKKNNLLMKIYLFNFILFGFITSWPKRLSIFIYREKAKLNGILSQKNR